MQRTSVFCWTKLIGERARGATTVMVGGPLHALSRVDEAQQRRAGQRMGKEDEGREEQQQAFRWEKGQQRLLGAASDWVERVKWDSSTRLRCRNQTVI
jgi:hypothetical protein